MQDISSYTLIISGTIIVILSYFFNIISEKTNIPSVLLLIILGIIIKEILHFSGVINVNFFPILEVLGIVGLIMIVLEASLDLDITKSKLKMILKSFLVAVLSLGASAYLIALVLQVFLRTDLFISILYALPLSIMSSAIIIPSAKNLPEEKKEFLIYESTFSDILGIMFFYFVLGSIEAESIHEIGFDIFSNISITIISSIVLSLVLLYIFQNLKSEIKLFLLISVLILIYAIGKSFHLSSLIMILVFGLMLNNKKYIFKGFLGKIIKPDYLDSVYKDLKLVTLETSFIVRTFFFVIFGASISLLTLLSFKVFLISTIVLVILYGIRILLFLLFQRKDIYPQIFLAPRGLITILLFYAIPQEFQVKEFDSGILLFVILVTSVLMAFSIIKYSRKLKLEQQQLIEQEQSNTTNNNSDDLTREIQDL